MAWLQVYEWERSKWPWHRKINIRPELRENVARGLAKLMGISLEGVTLSKRGGGTAYYRYIKLPMRNYDCALGLIMHEIAHLVNRQVYKGTGHKGTFKQALIKVYIESRPHLSRILREAKAKADETNRKVNEAFANAARNAAKMMEARQLRKTRPYKIQHLKKRIRKLDTRIKRLTTMRASAVRSLKAYERAEAIKTQERLARLLALPSASVARDGKVVCDEPTCIENKEIGK